MGNVRSALRQLATMGLPPAPIVTKPEPKAEPVQSPSKSAVKGPPPYNCIRCKKPVRLQLHGEIYSYACSCGNRSKVARKDYAKLRFFDVLNSHEEEVVI